MSASVEPARWTYDVDPATGNSRASYPGLVNVAGNPIGGPASGTGALLLQNTPTITTPIINGGTITSPTIATPAINGGTITSPTITTPTINGGTIATATIHGDTIATSAIDNTNTFGAGITLPQPIIQGVTNGSNAPAGDVGEYISFSRPVGSAVALTNNTTQDIISLALTAGDWDIQGNIAYQGAGGTIQIGATGWISTTSATLPPLPNGGGETIIVGLAPAANQTICIPVGPMRLSLGATTTVYLSTNTAFGSGTLSGYGFLGARRVR
jgi:hypothetical protein